MLRGVCLLLFGFLAWLLGAASGQDAPAPDPQAAGRPVHVAMTFTWTYPSGLPGHAGFQLVRCAMAGGTPCALDTGIGGVIPPAARTATEPTGEAGKGYCWGLRAITETGAHSAPTPAVCEVLPALGTAPLPVPQAFQKAP